MYKCGKCRIKRKHNNRNSTDKIYYNRCVKGIWKAVKEGHTTSANNVFSVLDDDDYVDDMRTWRGDLKLV